jgi:GTPase SAR1 family protein
VRTFFGLFVIGYLTLEIMVAISVVCLIDWRAQQKTFEANIIYQASILFDPAILVVFITGLIYYGIKLQRQISKVKLGQRVHMRLWQLRVLIVMIAVCFGIRAVVILGLYFEKSSSKAIDEYNTWTNAMSSFTFFMLTEWPLCLVGFASLYIVGPYVDGMVADLVSRKGEHSSLQDPLMPEENIDILIDALMGVNLSPDDVARNYNQVLMDGTQSFPWTKLVFVGQGRAGKTSLLRKLTNQPFDTNQEITDGADVCVVSNNTWERLERMADTNFERGMAEAVGQSLNEGTTSISKRSRARTFVWAVVGVMIIVIAGLAIGFRLRVHSQSSHTSGGGEQKENDSPWNQLSHGFKEGVICIGAILVLLIASICAYHQKRQVWKKQKDKAAGLIDLSQNVTADDIHKKMAIDLVVQVAKDGRKQEIIFHTWDFGGQQVYYVLHHIFITGGVYCLVFDMCEAQDKLQVCLRYLAFWLTSVHYHVSAAEECSIVLVGTHRDIVCTQEEHSLISNAIYSTFAHCSFWERVVKPHSSTAAQRRLCFFPVDNTSSIGIPAVLDAIKAAAQKFVETRVERPLRWRKILDHLLQMSQNTDYLVVKDDHTHSIKRSNADRKILDLWSIAKANGITDCGEFETMIVFFDSMGIFKRCCSTTQNQYRDVVILRPQWLVDIFSAVISDCNVQRETDRVPSELAHELYRFESKAILSIRLLRYLWNKKGVVTEPSDFEFLVELMVRFDLMFELRNNSGGDEQKERVLDSSRRFLVPAMLTDTESFSSVRLQNCSGENNARVLKCYFIFKEELREEMGHGGAGAGEEEEGGEEEEKKGGEEKKEEEEDDDDGNEDDDEDDDEDDNEDDEDDEEEEEEETLQSKPTNNSSGTRSRGGSGGMLPRVIFTKLQAKCASWAQATSNTEPRLSSTHAEVTFGGQKFELHLEQEACAIIALLRVYAEPHVVVSRLKHMLNEILESFPTLTYELNLRDEATGHLLPLERAQLEIVTQKALANTQFLEKFELGGIKYDCAQFDAWLPHRKTTTAVDNARQLYDVYICAHASDRDFVSRTVDCLTRQTDNLRIRCSRRVNIGEGAMEYSLLGKHAALRQDMFLISRSAVFVPIISRAALAQWSAASDTPRSVCFRALSFSMATLAVVDIFTDLWVTLLLLHRQQYWYGASILASLLVPFALHTLSLWHIVHHEYRIPNIGFQQWLKDHSSFFPVLFFLGALRPDILRNLLESQAFGWPLFLCPLSERSCVKLAAAGIVTNALHDLPQLCISVWLILHQTHAQYQDSLCNKHCELQYTAVMAVCSTMSLLFSAFSRLSAFLLLRTTQRPSTSPKGGEDVDEMISEYMTALQMHSRISPSQQRSAQPFPCQTIAPLVIEQVFQPWSKGMGPELIHPIDKSEVSVSTKKNYDQTLRRDLATKANSRVKLTTSGIVQSVLQHADTNKDFSGHTREWGVYDKAAQCIQQKAHDLFPSFGITIESSSGLSQASVQSVTSNGSISIIRRRPNLDNTAGSTASRAELGSTSTQVAVGKRSGSAADSESTVFTRCPSPHSAPSMENRGTGINGCAEEAPTGSASIFVTAEDIRHM